MGLILIVDLVSRGFDGLDLWSCSGVQFNFESFVFVGVFIFVSLFSSTVPLPCLDVAAVSASILLGDAR